MSKEKKERKSHYLITCEKGCLIAKTKHKAYGYETISFKSAIILKDSIVKKPKSGHQNSCKKHNKIITVIRRITDKTWRAAK